MDGGRRRRVLNKLDQPVAINDLAGGQGEVLSHLELFGTEGWPPVHGALPVLQQVPPTPHQVLAGFGLGLAEHDGVRPDEICW